MKAAERYGVTGEQWAALVKRDDGDHYVEIHPCHQCGALVFDRVVHNEWHAISMFLGF